MTRVSREWVREQFLAAKAMSRCPAPGLVRLLEQRHKEDIFIAECKMGAGDEARMDGYAIARSWAHPLTTGYEVKISRNDFLRDRKWRTYLPACNQFYFVAPSLDVIKPEELPDDVGLLITASTGTRLLVKKRPNPLWRAADEAAVGQMLRYILFWRVGHFVEPNGRNTSPEHRGRAFWENYFREEKADKDFGRKLRGRIGQKYRDDVIAVQAKQIELERRLSNYDDVRKLMADMGMLGEHVYPYAVQQQIQRVQAALPPNMVQTLHQLRDACTTMLAKIEPPKAEEEDDDENAA